MSEWTRQCPACNAEISYTSRRGRSKAERRKAKCQACARIQRKDAHRSDMRIKFFARATKEFMVLDELHNSAIEKAFNESQGWKAFCVRAKVITNAYKREVKSKIPLVLTRICMDCQKTITYKSEHNRQQADIKNTLCVSCVAKGERNHFHGKKHSAKTRAAIKASINSPARQKWFEHMRSAEYGAWASKQYSGTGNPRYGHGSLKDIWIRKLGEEEGTKKWDEWRAKLAISSEGENNPMYGKPSPQGSGNGWSGWYKDWFFRSLMELSFMINFIERFGFEWKSGESRAYMVPYVDYKDTKRNYFPDFILNDRYVTECKPDKLRETPSVIAKAAAAHELCGRLGLKYKVITPKSLTEEEILVLHQSGAIRFTERYEAKFRERYPFSSEQKP